MIRATSRVASLAFDHHGVADLGYFQGGIGKGRFRLGSKDIQIGDNLHLEAKSVVVGGHDRQVGGSQGVGRSVGFAGVPQRRNQEWSGRRRRPMVLPAAARFLRVRSLPSPMTTSKEASWALKCSTAASMTEVGCGPRCGTGGNADGNPVMVCSLRRGVGTNFVLEPLPSSSPARSRFTSMAPR